MVLGGWVVKGSCQELGVRGSNPAWSCCEKLGIFTFNCQNLSMLEDIHTFSWIRSIQFEKSIPNFEKKYKTFTAIEVIILALFWQLEVEIVKKVKNLFIMGTIRAWTPGYKLSLKFSIHSATQNHIPYKGSFGNTYLIFVWNKQIILLKQWKNASCITSFPNLF